MKILFVVNGDAETTVPWSGVPKRILDEMRRQGHEVVNFNLAEVPYFKWPRILFNRVIRRVIRSWINIPFETTRLSMWLCGIWLRRMVSQNLDADLMLATSFCLDCEGLPVKSILLHDWTVGYARMRLHGHALSVPETRVERNQLRALGTATKVVTLYPLVRDYLAKENGLQNVEYICNPINVIKQLDVAGRTASACSARRFLAIGGNFYRDNIECVIQAADALGDDTVVVDVIGRSSAETVPKHIKVNFHGFLNRADHEQCKRYYDVVAEARALINVKHGWGGASTISESMLQGLPVIIARYPEIEAMYGVEDGQYGYFCKPMDVPDLTDKMRFMLAMSDRDYAAMCQRAHAIVKDDTYDKFMGRLLAI